MRRVYLDHISDTPLAPQAAEAMKDCLDTFGNPSSLHAFGEERRAAVEAARRQVAEFIHADAREVCFVSCGTEANHLAIKGIAAAYRKRGNHVITSRVEHTSVLYAFKDFEANGYRVTYLPVNRFGIIDPDEVSRALTDETVLVSIQYANSEMGSVQPLRKIARLTRSRDVILHADAVAAAGRLPIDVETLGADALSLAANQLYGPEGVGALYLRRGVRLQPLLEGGVQEGGRRAGTENVPAIVGFGAAAEIASRELSGWRERLDRLGRQFHTGLSARLNRVVFTGHPEQRLPGHISLCLEFIEGEALVRALSQKGIAAATGSACRDYASRKISHVLESVGLDIRLAQGSLVFSLGKDNTPEDIEYTLQILPPLVERLRAISPVYAQTVKSRG